MNTKIITCLIGCCLGVQVFSQERAATDSLNSNPPQIINYDEFFSARLSFSDNFNSFKLKDKTGNYDLLISPNQQLNTTLSLAYRFLEIDLGYTPKFIRFNKDDDIRGKTKFFNLGTRFYLGQFMQNVQYRQTKGFYAEELEFPEFEKVIFSDLKVVKFGGSTSYIFNPDFSFRALFKQNEWQTKSAGSFVPSLSYYWTKLSDGSSGKDVFFDLTIGPSYYYNWIIADAFLIGVGAHAGMGYNHTKSTFTDGTPNLKSDGLIYTTELKLALGYNATRFFTGANFTFDSFYHHNEPDFRVDDQQRFFEFYLGYRFDAPRLLTKSTDYLENLMPGKKMKSNN